MNNPIRFIALAAAAMSLMGCAPRYSLVKAEKTKVAARTLEVQPTYAWNRAPRSAANIAQEENWTQNGVGLDLISFIGGLKDGAAIAKQNKKAAQQVPVFRSTMGSQDLVSMIESDYRIRGISVFETLSIQPVKFVGENGVQFDYWYIGIDDVKHRGRVVMAIAAGKLYIMKLSAVAIHYFDAALPEFEALMASAKLPNLTSRLPVHPSSSHDPDRRGTAEPWRPAPARVPFRSA